MKKSYQRSLSESGKGAPLIFCKKPPGLMTGHPLGERVKRTKLPRPRGAAFTILGIERCMPITGMDLIREANCGCLSV